MSNGLSIPVMHPHLLDDDLDRAAAEADLKAYAHNLAIGNDRCCLAIEAAWGLGGLPPEIVSCILAAVSEGASAEAALARWTAPSAAPASTCVETINGDPDTALRLSFQIKVF